MKRLETHFKRESGNGYFFVGYQDTPRSTENITVDCLGTRRTSEGDLWRFYKITNHITGSEEYWKQRTEKEEVSK